MDKILPTIREEMAKAIRGEPATDDTPWESLKAEHRVGWYGDADRAIEAIERHFRERAGDIGFPSLPDFGRIAKVRRASPGKDNVKEPAHTNSPRGA